MQFICMISIRVFHHRCYLCNSDRCSHPQNRRCKCMNGLNFPGMYRSPANVHRLGAKAEKPRLLFGKISHLRVSSPATDGYRKVRNFRSENRIQKGYPLTRFNTFDENLLIKRQAQHKWPTSFMQAIKDYLGYNNQAYDSTKLLLKKEIPNQSIACLGGKELYRGVAVPSELLLKVQDALEKTGHYGAKGMMHGNNREQHHGITSVSTLPEVANNFAAGRSARDGKLPLFIRLKMNKANPGRVVVPNFNCFAAGNQPHVWHEILLDRENEYAVKTLTYSKEFEMFVMEVAVSTDIFRRKSVLSRQDKITYWNSIYHDIQAADDSIVRFDYSGTPTFQLKSPGEDHRKRMDSDYNPLVTMAKDESKHEAKALGTNYRFKVVQAPDSTTEHPHYIILPRAIKQGNYKDLKSFLASATDEQKVSLLDTMTALVEAVPPRKEPYNPEVFRSNNGRWQRIPFFAIHYQPNGKNR
jgi:hypothetical protein